MNEVEQKVHVLMFIGYTKAMLKNDDFAVKFATEYPEASDQWYESGVLDKTLSARFVEWCADSYGRQLLPDDLSVFMENID